jgi:hypothetical protein
MSGRRGFNKNGSVLIPLGNASPYRSIHTVTGIPQCGHAPFSTDSRAVSAFGDRGVDLFTTLGE